VTPVSIVVPALNEAAALPELLACTRALKAAEVIVADGGSSDDTVAIARRSAVVIESAAGRGIQMNAGARAATGEILVFLHADCRIGAGALDAVRSAMKDPAIAGGNFNLRFEGNDAAAAAFTRINRLRRRCGVFYGDSGIFCRRSAFEALGGYREWPIMEDYDFARRLRRCGRLAYLEEPIWASDRRWRNSGLARTMWSWAVIQGLYSAGVSPRRLARLYPHIR
jgi:rSAM/selenodomain-associated transferase 2